jgi:hypothetical protein
MADDEDTYLEIYLNDHLGGATGALELAERVAKASAGTELGALMERLVDEIAEDRDTLREFMDVVDADRDTLKVAGGWIAEKLGRLKLNGKLIAESPLSRVVELEGLGLAVEHTRMLWVTLLETQAQRFGEDRLRQLIDRAERRGALLEEHRRRATREALGTAA